VRPKIVDAPIVPCNPAKKRQPPTPSNSGDYFNLLQFIVHRGLRRDLQGIVARCLSAMLVAPLDRPALRRLESGCVGRIVPEVARILHLNGFDARR
jgi:hypothetical protein